MEQRKVMKLGKSSLVISLPKEWLQMVEIDAGDVLTLEIQPNKSMTVFPTEKNSNEAKSITLHIDPNEDKNSIKRTIIACYLNGYSKIKFISRKIFTGDQQKTIRRIARILYINIVESTSQNIVMEILMDESRTSVISNLNRMFSISMSMIRDAFTALKERDRDLARSVFPMDDDVDHFCYFLLRLIRKAAIDPIMAKKLELDPNDTLDYQTLVLRIEHVADHAAEIANQTALLHESNLRIPDDLLDMLYVFGNEAIELYEKAINSFFTNDPTNCNSVIEKEKDIEESARKIASRTFSTDNIDAISVCAVCSIRDSIGRIYEWAKAIAETTILRSYH